MVRLLRGIVSGFWTPIPSRLVVSHEVRVGTGTGQLWVVATCGGIVGRAAVFILVLQNDQRQTLEQKTNGNQGLRETF